MSEADDSFTKPSGSGHPNTDENKVRRPYPTAIINYVVDLITAFSSFNPTVLSEINQNRDHLVLLLKPNPQIYTKVRAKPNGR